jgi:hypothetical protein
LKFKDEVAPIKLIVQLERVTTTKDGGSKIVFVCGAESLASIQKIQTLNATGDVSLAIACVPFSDVP